MLPIASSISQPVSLPPTLVATTLPGNTALRVPADSVAPSVSSVQVGNNARGNSTPVSAAEEEAVAAQSQASAQSASAYGNTQTPVSSGSTNFIAQLISQEVPESLQSNVGGILAEYEKLVAYSYVKYKPSDAAVPEPDPSGLFGRLIQESKAQPAIEAQPVQTETPVAEAPAQPVQQQASETETTAAPEAAPEIEVRIITFASAPPVVEAASAYSATQVRNNQQANAQTSDSA